MRNRISITVMGVALLAVFGLTGHDAVSPPPAEATETQVLWGPWNVPAGGNVEGFFNATPLPCTDCYITAITPELVYGDGSVANYVNGPMLHHFVIFNTGAVDITCGHIPIFSSLGERFFASGNERSQLQLPAPYGYYNPPSNWTLNVHIHNTHPTLVKTVYIRVTFTHVPATDPIKSVRPVWLDENNCSSSQYPICNSGPYPCYDDRHWDWTSGADGPTSSVEGSIVTIGGHVHDWGISVSAQKVQTEDWLCASSGGYGTPSLYEPDAAASPPRPNDAGHPADAIVLNPGDSMYNGHIEEMTGCTPNARIKPGDTLRLHAQYNADSPIPDVMGIMTAFVYDNCAALSNPDQHDTDNDLLGDPCDPDVDGDAIPNGSDPEADGDNLSNAVETACGSDPLHGLRRPERIDLVGDDDGDTIADLADPLPGGSDTSDCDGDGWPGNQENLIYNDAPGTLRDQDACGNNGWPSDLAANNTLNIADIGSFLTPARSVINPPADVHAAFNRFSHPLDDWGAGGPGGGNPPDGIIDPEMARWDLQTPPHAATTQINIGDLNALITGAAGSPARPPMFGNQQAFFTNGGNCPWPP